MQNNNSELVVQNSNSKKLQENDYDQKKVDLIKRTICKGATDDELQLFIQACKKTGLDPFMRQIFAVKRWDSAAKREVMTIQTGIDGYRLIADRTGRYAPGRNPEFTYDDQGNLRSAKAYIKKKTPDGKWHEVSSEAFWDEYVQTTKDGTPTHFWKNKGHIMLSKCAETSALRKAFPAELSLIHVQAEEAHQEAYTPQPQSTEPLTKITKEQAGKLKLLLSQFADCEQKTENILSFLKVGELKDIPEIRFNPLVTQLESQLTSKG